MTLTSPPYDGIRNYGGHPWDFGKFKQIAQELYRVTMNGGVVVWVVQDQIINGGESGTSFAQALYFQSLGFTIHETLIITKNGRPGSMSNRYDIPPEYAFVFSIGRPNVFHPILDRPNKYAGHLMTNRFRNRDGIYQTNRGGVVPAVGKRRFVWHYIVNQNTTTRDRHAYQHPALMPEQLAEDMILSWSNPGSLVLDPMCGAGTTLKMAPLNHRFYLGFDVH